jgi:hypothetical protein
MRLVESRQRVRSYGDINRYGLCGRRSVIYDNYTCHRNTTLKPCLINLTSHTPILRSTHSLLISSVMSAITIYLHYNGLRLISAPTILPITLHVESQLTTFRISTFPFQPSIFPFNPRYSLSTLDPFVFRLPARVG